MSNKKQRVIMRFKNDEFISQLHAALHSSGKIKVNGLGIFEIRAVAEREGMDISTKNRIIIPAHNKVVFRPTKKLRELIQTYGD